MPSSTTLRPYSRRHFWAQFTAGSALAAPWWLSAMFRLSTGSPTPHLSLAAEPIQDMMSCNAGGAQAACCFPAAEGSHTSAASALEVCHLCCQSMSSMRAQATTLVHVSLAKYILTASTGLLALVDMPGRLLAGKRKVTSAKHTLLNKLLEHLSSACAERPPTVCCPGKHWLGLHCTHHMPDMPYQLLQQSPTMY